MGIWVNWSPDEKHALIEMGAEDGPPLLFLLNLITNVKKEIRFKSFSRHNENQAFDADSISWINKDAFRVDVNIYTGDDRFVRKYPAQVNLATLVIAYPHARQPSRTASLGQTGRTAESAPATRSSQNPSNSLDDCKFCGDWKAVAGGRSGRYNLMDKT